MNMPTDSRAVTPSRGLESSGPKMTRPAVTSPMNSMVTRPKGYVWTEPSASSYATGTGGVVLVEGPFPSSPQALSTEGSVIFTWSYTATTKGSVVFSTSVTGRDALSGTTLALGPVTSGLVMVQNQGSLASHLVLPSPISSGQVFGITLTVTNAGDAVVSGITPEIQLTSGAGLLEGPTGPSPSGPVDLPSGASVTFAWSYTAMGAGTVCWTATASGMTCGTTAVASVDIGCTALALPSAVALKITAPASVTAGVSFTVTVTAVDALGHLVPTYVGTVLLATTDPLGSIPGSLAFVGSDAGVRALQVALRTPGVVTISGVDSVAPTVNGSAKVAVLCPATFDSLVLSVPVMVFPGVAFSMTVTAFDKFGAMDTNFKGTVAFATTDSVAVLPSPYTFTSGKAPADNGIHRFTVTLGTAGVQAVVANDAGAQCRFSGFVTTSVVVPVVYPPLNLSATSISGGEADLTWTPSQGNTFPVSCYLVYRSTDGSAFILAGRASGTANSFEDTLCCFGIYYYQLRAVDTLGNVSATSNTAFVAVVPEREWPFASYWVHHQGFSEFPTPVLPLEIKWRSPTNAGPFAVAGAVIKNGRVYQSRVDRVDALELATGSFIASTGSIPDYELVGAETSPAVIGRRLIVGAESFSGVYFGAARVHAYDTDTLSWLWTSDADGIGGFSNIVSANGLVFVGAYNQLTALSIEDGSLVWQRTIGNFANNTVGGPVVCDNLVYATFGNGTIVAVDANTGVTKWSRLIGVDPVGNVYEPLLKNGRILVGSGLSVLVLDAFSGAPVGQMIPIRGEPEAGVLSYPPVIDSANRVFFFSGGDEEWLGIMPILHAFDASAAMSGGLAALLWERSDLMRCPMSTVNGVLYAFQDEGFSEYPAGMMLLDNTTGNLLQRIEEVPYPSEGLNTHPAWGPAFSGDYMVVRGSSAVTDLFALAPGPGVSPPTGLIAVGGVGTIDLGWQAPAQASFPVAEYRIFNSTFAGGFNFGTPLATVNATFFTDSAATGLVPDMTLYYVVRARDIHVLA